MKTKLIIIGIATVLVVAITFKLKSNKQTVEANVYRPDLDKKVLVEASVAQVESLKKTFTYTGTLTSRREVMLVPQVNAQVDQVYFEEGDVVKKGALLVQLDDDLLQARFRAADVNLQTAKRNLQRYENASHSGGVSKLQIDNLSLNVSSAESERSQLAKQISLCRIVAPFSGTITLREVEVGSVVGSGAPVARISELAELKLEISVPEKEIGFFRKGKTAQVLTDIYPGKTIPGSIEYVADRADNAHNYDVYILIKNTDALRPLKAGMYGRVVLGKNVQSKAVIIPRSALLGSAKNPQVYRINNGRSQLTKIQTGETTAELVEVLDGLHAGDSVVTSGHINLSEGSRVDAVK